MEGMLRKTSSRCFQSVSVRRNSRQPCRALKAKSSRFYLSGWCWQQQQANGLICETYWQRSSPPALWLHHSKAALCFVKDEMGQFQLQLDNFFATFDETQKKNLHYSSLLRPFRLSNRQKKYFYCFRFWKQFMLLCWRLHKKKVNYSNLCLETSTQTDLC